MPVLVDGEEVQSETEFTEEQLEALATSNGVTRAELHVEDLDSGDIDGDSDVSPEGS